MRDGSEVASGFLAIPWAGDTTGSHRSEQLVFALALLWLAFLVYPLVTVIGLIAQSADVTRWLPPAAGLIILGAIYVWAIWRGSSIPRRSGAWPMIAALTALALALPLAFGADWFGGFLYACIVAGLALPPRQALGTIVFFSALTLLMGSILGIIWWEMVAITLLSGLGGAVTFGIVWLLDANEELRAARAEIARLAASQERQRLMRDLHDAVKQQVFVTAMEIGAARALLERDPQTAATHLTRASASIHQAQSELTTLIRQPDATFRPAGNLAPALRAYVEDWSRQTGIAVEQTLPEECAPAPSVREAFYRVAQEALANIARHSQATTAGIALEATGDDTLTLRIWDNGRGFALEGPSPDAEGGYGLRSMRERIEALGGTFVIESVPGKGTRITCVYRGNDAADATGKERQ